MTRLTLQMEVGFSLLTLPPHNTSGSAAMASASARCPAARMARPAAARALSRAAPSRPRLARCPAHAMPLEYVATSTLVQELAQEVQELVSTTTAPVQAVQPVQPQSFASFVGGSDLTVIKFAAVSWAKGADYVVIGEGRFRGLGPGCAGHCTWAFEPCWPAGQTYQRGGPPG